MTCSIRAHPTLIRLDETACHGGCGVMHSTRSPCSDCCGPAAAAGCSACEPWSHSLSTAAVLAGSRSGSCLLASWDCVAKRYGRQEARQMLMYLTPWAAAYSDQGPEA
jgi:hypothetical protein